MGGTTRNGHDTRALRVLGLLAVLLGLLAMHGLASSHHAPASASASTSAAVHSAATSPVHEPGAARDHHNADAVVATQQSSALPASTAGSSCEQDCSGAVFALCVAVLAATAALAAAIVLRRRRRGSVESAAVGVVRAPASARSAFPPPDPVRELCVSRT